MFGSLFKKKPEAADLPMQGQPVHVNVAPASRAQCRRHLARLLHLMEHVAKPHLPATVTDAAIEEMRRRRKMRAAAGIDAPQDRDGIQKLLDGMEG